MEPTDDKHLGPQLVKAFDGGKSEPVLSTMVRICIIAAFGIILLAAAVAALMM